MATGFQGSQSSNVDVIQLIAGATSANTVAVSSVTLSETPTVAQYYDLRAYRAIYGSIPDEAMIVIRSTAGSGVMTLGACRVMVCDAPSAVGMPLGVGGDATKGLLNNGAGFAEDATYADTLFHREVISGLSMVDGIQVQLGAIAGTGTAIRVELHVPRFRRAVA